MQPNQNMSGMGQSLNSASPVRPVGSAGVAEPVKTVDPTNNAAFNNGPSVVEDKGGKKTGWIIGLILCLLLAAGGIGFGVWAWMEKDNEADKLSKTMDVLKTFTDKQVTFTNSEGETTNIRGLDIENTDGYLYVGEWGLKIKIPDDANVVNYMYQHYDMFDGEELDNQILYVTIVPKTASYLMSYSDMPNNGALGWIIRVPKDSVLAGNRKLVFSSDDYDYYYSSPSGSISSVEGEEESEKEGKELVQQMLSDQNNYSAI